MEFIETRLEEIESSLGKIEELSPNELSAWGHFSSVTSAKGALSTRGKEIIVVALSVLSKYQWCIPFHVNKALELGARKQEIIEAAWVAVLMGGSPVLMYSQLVLEALEELQEYEKREEMTCYSVGSAKLFQQLLSYVDSVCDEAEGSCNDNEARRRLALNIAESNSRIIERLVIKECDNREWEDLEDIQPNRARL